ncbi:CamS family sex pheromone protein [Suicoccus acidiformans]|uniref:CamS family sex pheromone protein n=1 Tax=Suicoccus acidiformans TaxID=2036206 RepID=A0A347WI95_9LACT|nr:CamS family sex pheromone protein [Suicoccus acidiformans]AXY24802.1 CamS family sex pheromone protein [Suicoccus acidiformans]
MKERIFKLSTLLVAATVFLTGCLNSGTGDEEAESLGPNEATVQTTSSQLSNDYYRAVIVDGQYQLGASANADASTSSAGNVEAFEEGLLRISKEVFPTDQYYMQEGQIIDEETMTSWLSRESPTNPEGLNPAAPDEEEIRQRASESVAPSDAPEDPENPENIDNPEQEGLESSESSVSDPAESTQDEPGEGEALMAPPGNVSNTPIYISQIMEKDIMTETDDGFAISGIVIGLAMNSVYEYTDANGVVHQQEISVGEMRERGKQYANIIVGRLRNTEELRSVPIVVGLYSTAPNNAVVGGTYMVDGISREGNAVTDWTERNEYRVALPLVSSDQQTDQFLYFDNFQQEVAGFFPNLNGISGEALYADDQLVSLEIEVVTQFYQKSEITALAQHINDVAQRTLPSEVAIEITIRSANGIEAYVGRPAGATQFENHIFN